MAGNYNRPSWYTRATNNKFPKPIEGRYAGEGFRQWVSLNYDEYADEENVKMRWGTDLPLPVISKLLAGHTRLLMTIYYSKISPAVMTDIMTKAHMQLQGKSTESLRLFLKNCTMDQLQYKTAYHDEGSIRAALANRNPIGWEKRYHGLCLVGGNTTRSDDVLTLAGCWNGGEFIGKRSNNSWNYGPVPHGPENCVRCRWFITEACFLPQSHPQLALS